MNLDEIDLHGQARSSLDFNFSQYFTNTLIGSMNVLSLSCLLYPLERAQIVKQVQTTYTSQSLKFCQNVFTRCSYFGVRSTFRGLKITMFRNSFLFSLYQFINNFKHQENKLAQNILKGLVGAAGFFLVYPFQNIKVRMVADLQQERYYNNIRDCIKKMKKHEGAISFYRGFSAGAIHLGGQYLLIKTLIEQKYKYQEQFSNNVLLFCSLYLTSFAFSEVLLYPIDTLKKTLQINGSLGHDDENKKIRNALKNLSFANYYRGLPIRMANSLFYVALSFMIGEIGQNA